MCHAPPSALKQSYLSRQSVSKENWTGSKSFVCPQQINRAAAAVQGARGSVPGGEALGQGGLLRAELGPGGLEEGAQRRSPSIRTQPRSHPMPSPRWLQKGFPHIARKRSYSEVAGEESGKEILVEGEVTSFKLQGFSSWSFQVASIQHFTVFLEKTFECLTTLHLNKVGNWEWKGRWFPFEQKGTAAVQAVACIYLPRITVRAVAAELPQTKAR